ncbi:endolytic transglycosylase MltG [Streptococcus caprae]|uniref:Endolytic murein transglycosylase n=1 Tax=Streptococcus caprae TaxID=1640501 RepID=A0ABV8CXL9_9STRE
MTDNQNDTNKVGNQPLSFKEQILADLEEAVRQRRLREEEELEKERLAKEEAKHQAELELQRLESLQAQKEAALVSAAKEQARQEAAARATIQAEKAQEEAKRAKEEAAKAQAIAFAQMEQEQERLKQEALSRQVTDVTLVAESENVTERDLDQTQYYDKGTLAKSLATQNDDLAETKSLPVDLIENQQTGIVEDSSDNEELENNDKLRRDRHRQQNNRIARKISLGIVAVIAAVVLLTGIFTYRFISSAIGPVDADSTEYVQVEIPSGSGNKLIGQILEKAGVIKSATVFNYYTKFKNYSNFQSGYYNVQKSMDLDDIAELLQQGGTAEPVTPALGKILVPEGYTIEQIAEAVAVNAGSKKGDASPYKAKDFLNLVQDEDFISKMVEKYPKLLGSLPDANQSKYQLEGYLFPATYAYYDGTTLEDIVDQMLAAMDSNLAAYYDEIVANGQTVNDVLTLASLVEKEGSTDDDRKNIASVFYNRLNADMPLQSNIAILYAMGTLGQSTTLKQDTTVDTSIDSPYNVYTNTGLMPGPVDSPSLAAIEATMAPSDTDYLYFVADVTTGEVYYTTDYEEHLSNVEKYVNSKVN